MRRPIVKSASPWACGCRALITVWNVLRRSGKRGVCRLAFRLAASDTFCPWPRGRVAGITGLWEDCSGSASLGSDLGQLIWPLGGAASLGTPRALFPHWKHVMGSGPTPEKMGFLGGLE